MSEQDDLDRALDALLSSPAPLDAKHRLNTDKTVAVSTTQYWEDIASCPRGAKVQLLGQGGVAVYGLWDGKNPFWTHWAPVPRRRE